MVGDTEINADIHPESSLRMGGTTSLLPLDALMAWTESARNLSSSYYVMSVGYF